MKVRELDWVENNLPLLLAAFVILLLIGVIQSFRLPEINRTVTVGGVFIGDRDDRGWNQSHYSGLLSACNAYDCDFLVKDSVPEEEEAVIEAVDSLVADGCNVIYLTSYGYGAYVDKVAERYPRVAFFSIHTESKAKNSTTYFARLYQVRYLSGIIAGVQSRTGVVGYVAAMSNSETNRGINAYALGLRKANPKARLIVRFTGEWVNEPVERESVALLQAKGADLITYHQDRPYVLQEAEERGLYSIGFGSLYEHYSDRCLTAALYDWKVIYGKVLGDYLSGRANFSDGYWLGLEENAVKLKTLSPLVSEQALVLTAVEKQRLMKENGVFSDEIHDNQGKLRCVKGERIKDTELFSAMDWFVEGVEIYE